ncbi:MAG: Ppx/GppA family phosphatase [Bauldia sp.]|nr:Ppx/GppA family phosphatase [Bauldia sp.]
MASSPATCRCRSTRPLWPGSASTSRPTAPPRRSACGSVRIWYSRGNEERYVARRCPGVPSSAAEVTALDTGDGRHHAGPASPDTDGLVDDVARLASGLPEAGGAPPGSRSGRKRRRRGRRGHAGITPADRGVARETRAEPADQFYAALDLGTNNCRLLVASPRERGFRVVDSFSRIIRLGEGVGASGRLSEAAMDRAIVALRICQSKLESREVRRSRLIATEACRLAENGQVFIDRVRDETGLSLEIVSREVEARLAVAGCASLVDPTSSGAVLFDIGGGSSELVWLDLENRPGEPRRRLSERVRSWQSLPIGVVTLSERHGGERVDHGVFETMVGEVSALLSSFPEVEALDRLAAAGRIHMLGTSGTVTTLAGVHLRLPRYDRRQIDGVWMTSDEVDATVEQLRAMDFDARVAHPCIGRERADLVLAGCAILEAVRRRWPAKRLRVADRGLREGILVELMSQDGVWRNRNRHAGEARSA